MGSRILPFQTNGNFSARINEQISASYSLSDWTLEHWMFFIFLFLITSSTFAHTLCNQRLWPRCQMTGPVVEGSDDSVDYMDDAI